MLKNLGRVNEENRGFQELFQTDDGYIVVSTLGALGAPDVAEGLDAGNKTIVELAGVFGGYATSGEETMVFPADAEGNITDWGEITKDVGTGSRERVLKELEVSP